MARILLIPSPTGDGRIVLRAVELTPAERLRRLARRARRALSGR